jgi:hypothetical protein
MDNFGGDLWKSFKSVYGPVLAALALILAIGSFFYEPTSEIRFSWKWAAVIVPFGVTACATFVDMLVTARRMSYPRLPRVISVYSERRPGYGGDAMDEETVLLLEPSELFGYDGVVSIYYNQRLGGADARPFERLIGVGRVSNIQEEKIIAITVLRSRAGQEAIWRRIRDRESAALADLRVKPTVPFGETGLGATTNE